jgi:hypothetical protein
LTPTKDPLPRHDPIPAQPFAWPVTAKINCAPIIDPPDQRFTEVLERRRCERHIDRAPLGDIVNVLAFTMRPRFSNDDEFGRTKRPAMSAGALHPISVLIIPNLDDQRVLHYNPREHCLESLQADSNCVKQSVDRCRVVLPEADGTYLVFAADTTITGAVYECPESLIWRDAGALLQTIAMVSTAFQLVFCPLGLLGSEIAAMLGDPCHIISAGVAVVGQARRSQATPERTDD